MMLIAQAQYTNTTTLQGALIRIVQRRMDYAITANIGGEDDGAIPAWVQTATTEQDARLIGNAFHKALKGRYAMTRIA
jgi:hypothetical protein